MDNSKILYDDEPLISYKKKQKTLTSSEDIKNSGSGAEYVAKNLGLGAYGIFEGSYNLVRGGLSSIFGGEMGNKYAQYLFSNSEHAKLTQELNEAYNPGKGMQFVGDVAQGIGQSSVFYLNALGVPVGTALFFAGAAGQGVSEAAQLTGELGAKEYAYGITSGAVEGALELLSGAAGAGLGKAGKTLTGTLEKTLGKVGKETAKHAVRNGVIKSVISGAASEFFEEFLGAYAEVAMKHVYQIDPNAQYSFADAVYQGLVGAASGGLMEGTQTAVRATFSHAQGAKIISEGKADALVSTVKTMQDQVKSKDWSKYYKAEEKKDVRGYINNLVAAYEAYQNLAADQKTGDRAKVYLGEMQTNLAILEAIIGRENMIKHIRDNADKYVKYAEEIRGEKFTAEDIRNDKNGILTQLGIARWALMFNDVETVWSHRQRFITEQIAKNARKGIDTTGEGNAVPGSAQTVMSRAGVTKSGIEWNENDDGGVLTRVYDLGNGRNAIATEEEDGTWTLGVGTGETLLTEEGENLKMNVKTDDLDTVVANIRDNYDDLIETARQEQQAKETESKETKKEKSGEGSDKRKSKSGNVVKGEGNVKYATAKDLEFARLDPNKTVKSALNAKQKATLTLLSKWFDKSGYQILVFEGNGYGANGAYRGNTIYLDINASMLQIAAHELTHSFVKRSPAMYGKLRNFIIETEFKGDRTKIDAAIDKITELYAKNGEELSRDVAEEEIIAKSCENVFGSVEALKDMFAFDDRLFGEANRYLGTMEAFFDSIIQSYGAENEYASAMSESVEDLKELRKRFAEAMRASLKPDQTKKPTKTKTAKKSVTYNLSEDQVLDAINRDDELGVGEVFRNKDGEMTVAENVDGTKVLFSYTTYEEGGRAKLAQVLRDQGYTKEEVKAAMEPIERMAKFLKKTAEQYSVSYGDLKGNFYATVATDIAHAKQVLSTLVNNGEYPVNLDLQLICKKRVAYMKLMARLLEDGVFGKVKYDGSAIAMINEILSMQGYETACLGCFVESRRLQLQKWSETIAQEWNDEVKKRKPDATPFAFVEDTSKTITAEEMVAVEQELSTLEKNDKGNVKFRSKAVKNKMGELLDQVPSLLHTITADVLLTPDGLKAIRATAGGGTLISLIKSRYGAASPKLVQEFNPYNSEIADLSFSTIKELTGNSVTGAGEYVKKAQEVYGKRPSKEKGETDAAYKKRVEKWNREVNDLAIRSYLFDIGGTRIQSFSDFMIENVFDYFQIMGDLAARGFPLHGYTKEIVFLKLFGQTGTKGNGSLIATLAQDKSTPVGLISEAEYESLKVNGKIPKGLECVKLEGRDGKTWYIGFDDYARSVALKKQGKAGFVQSIGMKDIMALILDPRYSKDAGNITIGVSDEQIIAMLRSPLFRMVIPYHKSGMLPEFANLVGVDRYTDYTDYQTTRLGQLYDLNHEPVEKLIEEKKSKKDKNVPEEDRTEKQPKIRVEGFNFNARLRELGDAKAVAKEYIDWCNQEHPVVVDGKLIGYAKYLPKFSGDESKGLYDFTKEENYYKLLEDFNVYDAIDEFDSNKRTPAPQNAVSMVFPGDAGSRKLTKAELEAYRKRLEKVGIYNKDDIDKIIERANWSAEDIILHELEGRAQYKAEADAKWEPTVGLIENALMTKERHKQFQTYADFEKKRTSASEKVRKNALGIRPVNGTYKVETWDPSIRKSIEEDSDGNALTEDQRRYFADSQVRDREGRLLPMYHGTGADFTVFDRGHIGSSGRMEGSGFNFTPSYERAKSYSNGGKVMSGYLNIANPISSDKRTINARQLAGIIAEIDPTGDNIISNYADDTSDYGTKAFLERESRITAKKIIGWAKSDADIYSELSSANPDAESLINKFKTLGYDGVIHYNENGNIKTAVAFDSNQFKLADNIAPTAHQDIRYSLPEIQNASDKELTESYNTLVKENPASPELKTIVEEYGKRKGFTQKLFHGTPHFGFTKIKFNVNGGDGYSFWTTANPKMASTYSATQPEISSLYYDQPQKIPTNFSEMSFKELEDVLSKLHTNEKLSPFSSFEYVAPKMKGVSKEKYEQWATVYAWAGYHHLHDYNGTDTELIDAVYHLLDEYNKGKPSDEKQKHVEDMLAERTRSQDNAEAAIADVLLKSIKALSTLDYSKDEGYLIYAKHVGDEIVKGILNKEQLVQELENLSDEAKNYVPKKGGIYELLGRTDGFLDIDAKGANWDHIKPPKELYDAYHAYMKTRDVAEWAKGHGYPGIIIRNLYDNGGKGIVRGLDVKSDVFIFFNGNDLRSADAVTYDNDENVIPLEERFKDTDDSDLRWSVYDQEAAEMSDKELNDDYERRAAINPCDPRLTSLVVEYGKRHGYTKKLFHGTSRFGFTKIDMDESDDGFSFWTTDNTETAKTYSGKEEVRAISTKDDELDVDHMSFSQLKMIAESYFMDYNEWYNANDAEFIECGYREAPSDYYRRAFEIAQEYISQITEHSAHWLDELSEAEWDKLRDVSEDDVEYIQMEDVEKAERIISKLSDEEYHFNWLIKTSIAVLHEISSIRYGDGEGYVIDQDGNIMTKERMAEITKAAASAGDIPNAGNYELLGDIRGFLEIDAKGANWNRIPTPGWMKREGVDKPYLKTRNIAEFAKEGFFRGVIIKNVYDSGGKAFDNGYGDVYVFFDGKALKSADQVTYDDNGKIIPLDQRFNEKDEDLRYSVSDKRGRGYDGRSMSVNARNAYAAGEMPLSKWTRAAIVDAIEGINSDIDVSKINLPTLRKEFLKSAGWHHTGAMYSATDFYGIDEDKISSMTQEDVDKIAANQTRAETKPKRTTDYDAQVDSAYSQIKAVMEAGLSKLKTEAGLVKRIISGAGIATEYEAAMTELRKKAANVIANWRKLPENRLSDYHRELIAVYDSQGADEFIRRYYLDRRENLNRNSKLFKELRDYFEKRGVEIEDVRHSFVGTAYLTEERIDKYLKSYAIPDKPTRSQAWIGRMDPKSFIPGTTDIIGRSYLYDEVKPLDVEELKSEHQPIFFTVSVDSNGKPDQITGHEGRHRMTAIGREGIWSAPVILFDGYENWEDNRKTYGSLTLFGQGRGTDMVFVHDAVPLDYAHRDEIIKSFSTPSYNDQWKEKHRGQEILRYSIPDGEGKTKELLYTAEEQDEARDYVSNFDAYMPETKTAILEFLRSAKGTKADKKTLRMVSNVIAASDTLDVRFADTEQKGVYVRGEDGQQLILIDSKLDSAAAVRKVISAEMIHMAEQTGEGYEKFARLVLAVTSPEEQEKVKTEYKEFWKESGIEISDKDLLHEAVSELGSDVIQDYDLVEKWAQKDKTFVMKLLSAARSVARSLFGKDREAYKQAAKITAALADALTGGRTSGEPVIRYELNDRTKKPISEREKLQDQARAIHLFTLPRARQLIDEYINTLIKPYFTEGSGSPYVPTLTPRNFGIKPINIPTGTELKTKGLDGIVRALYERFYDATDSKRAKEAANTIADLILAKTYLGDSGISVLDAVKSKDPSLASGVRSAISSKIYDALTGGEAESVIDSVRRRYENMYKGLKAEAARRESEMQRQIDEAQGVMKSTLQAIEQISRARRQYKDGYYRYQGSLAAPEIRLLTDAVIAAKSRGGFLVPENVRRALIAFNNVFRIEQLKSDLNEEYEVLGMNVETLKELDYLVNQTVKDYDEKNEDKMTAALTAAEVETFADVARATAQLYRTYNKYWDAKRKAWIDADETAKRGIDVVEDVDKLRETDPKLIKGMREIMNKYGIETLDPLAVARLLDGYDDDGIMTEIITDIMNAENAKTLRIRNYMRDVDEYIKKMKGFEKHLTAEEDMIEYRGVKMTRDEFIQLYMTTFRKQALLHLALGRTEIGTVGSKYGLRIIPPAIDVSELTGSTDKVESPSIEDLQSSAQKIAAEIQRLGNKVLTAEDKEYIALMEKFYNEVSTKDKSETDYKYFGMTNVINDPDDKYVPIVTSGSSRASSITDERSSMLDFATLAGQSFNKNTIRGAKNPLSITGAYGLMQKHANGLAAYAELYAPMQKLDRIWSTDINHNRQNSKRLRDVLKNTYGDNVEKYVRNLMGDIQGINTKKPNAFNAIIGRMRSNYAIFQLGANPKTWFNQLGSMGALFRFCDLDSIAKGLTAPNLDKMADYSSAAAIREGGDVVVKAQTLTNQVTGKVKDLMMKPIGWSDMKIVSASWGACQYQIEKEKGYAIGSEENLKAAGELLNKVINESQDTSLASTKTGIARSDNELIRSLAMFRSAPFKQYSRMTDAIGTLSVLSAKKKAGRDVSAQRFAQAKRELARTGAGWALQALIGVAVTLLFNWLYDKDKEVNAKELALDYSSELISVIPVVGDLYNYIVSGYDLSYFAYDMLNDGLAAMQNTAKTVGRAISGDRVTRQEIAKMLNSDATVIGQFTGMPTRNVKNALVGLTKRISSIFGGSLGYSLDAAMYSKSYQSDLQTALEDGNTRLAERIVELLYQDKKAVTKASEAAVSEVVRLYGEGFTQVLPPSVSSTITVDGVEYDVTAKDQKKIRQIANGADAEVTGLINSQLYKSLDDADKAKAIGKLYDIYYDRALTEVFGVPMTKADAISRIGDAKTIFAAAAHIANISADKDASGKAITNSRKQKVNDYLMSLGLDTDTMMLILYASGYSSDALKSQVGNIAATADLDADTYADVYGALGLAS